MKLGSTVSSRYTLERLVREIWGIGKISTEDGAGGAKSGVWEKYSNI
ncbi:hypothetical protein pah_c022o258 [Parachlamydia acanthamoebae str. Hall's coccus]|nr:hypothetical protein pah_c022o258 [Parachlamydia acanthamoebae str. Hall's coccus]